MRLAAHFRIPRVDQLDEILTKEEQREWIAYWMLEQYGDMGAWIRHAQMMDLHTSDKSSLQSFLPTGMRKHKIL